MQYQAIINCFDDINIPIIIIISPQRKHFEIKHHQLYTMDILVIFNLQMMYSFKPTTLHSLSSMNAILNFDLFNCNWESLITLSLLNLWFYSNRQKLIEDYKKLEGPDKIKPFKIFKKYFIKACRQENIVYYFKIL
jgi:hypothetical protein